VTAEQVMQGECTIKITHHKKVGEIKAVRIKLAGVARPLRRALPPGKRKAPEEEEAPAGDDDPYARKFKPRRRAAT